MRKPKPHGYDYTTDQALAMLITTRRSLVGDTRQARDLIMALCDQIGMSLEVQRAIRALITPAPDPLDPEQRFSDSALAESDHRSAQPCTNCGNSTHARCCAYCGKVHSSKRRHHAHCSAKCDAAAVRADRISDAMEQDALEQGK